MKGVQCYELFGGIALKIHTFSFFSFSMPTLLSACFECVFSVTVLALVFYFFIFFDILCVFSAVVTWLHPSTGGMSVITVHMVLD